jgi:hypothetical protein
MTLCAHCRVPLERKEITWDHIPPKGMFPSGTTGIIQVPCCQTCNTGASNDDEHFRLMAIDFTANESSILPSQSAARGLLHPKKEKFRDSLFNKAIPIEVETTEGICHGYKMPVSVSRLMRTAEKIVRGLYYEHKGYPIPEGFLYPCLCLNTTDELTAGVLQSEVIPLLQTPPINEIGNGVFRYRYCFTENSPDNAAFLMGFYGWVDFLSLVAPATGLNVSQDA